MDYVEFSCAHVHGRKEYLCEWCNETIQKKEKHLSRAYKLEGEVRQGRMHLECEKAYRDWAKECYQSDDDCSWYPGQFKRGTFECH